MAYHHLNHQRANKNELKRVLLYTIEFSNHMLMRIAAEVSTSVELHTELSLAVPIFSH
jgi:hypothetical protein